MTAIRVVAAKFSSARPHEVRSGLLGWVAVTLHGGYLLDGITVRRTSAGRVTLSFPAKVDAHGIQRAYFKPLTDLARRELEEQVLAAIGREHELTP